MAYNLKEKKKKEKLNKYYSDLETQELRRKYHGKIPPFTEVTRVAMRRGLGVEKVIHHKGVVVYYKDKLAIVRKSSKKGLVLERFKTDKDEISYPSGKTVFVPQHKIEHTVYPVFFPSLSAGTFAPYNMATIETGGEQDY